eukprot:3684414-Rhodomonas_salina.3
MENKKLWEPAVEFRIPDGCEYVDPKPEKNHFCRSVCPRLCWQCYGLWMQDWPSRTHFWNSWRQC